MGSASHRYNISVPDAEIRRRLADRDKPWWDPVVLRYLHHELNMSLVEIGNVFGNSRQSIHEAAKEVGVETERKHGGSYNIDDNQKRLSDYERTGLSDYL